MYFDPENTIGREKKCKSINIIYTQKETNKSTKAKIIYKLLDKRHEKSCTNYH